MPGIFINIEGNEHYGSIKCPEFFINIEGNENYGSIKCPEFLLTLKVMNIMDP